MNRYIRWMLLIGFAISLLQIPLHSQQITGAISGAITDTTGAVVPNATVTIINLGTNDVHKVDGGAQGSFTVTQLPEGHYHVTINAQGFKSFVSKDVVVHVATTTTLNAQLQPGSVSETVTVESDAVQVQTDTASLGQVIEGQQVKELPLNGRSFVELTQLTPGVSAANNFDTKNKGLQGGVDMSVNGNPTTNNLFIIDGVNNNDVGSNRTILIYPSIDAIAEFKMLTNDYGPEYGQASGAIVNIVTRSGSNQFHGSAFYSGRNDALDAYTFFSAQNAGKGLPLDGKDKLRRNDWGYSIGGPIKKDKLFFFWSEEWNHEIRGRQVSSCVPTAAERGGDFSTPGCNTTAPNFGKLPAGTYTGLKLNSVDPSAVTMLQMLPLPNLNGFNSNHQNWSVSLPTGLFWREENVRGDYDLNKTNHISGRYTQDTWTNPSFNAGYWGDTPFPALDSNWAQPSKSTTIHWIDTLSTTLVNDVAFNYSNNRITITPGGTDPGLLAKVTAAIPTLYPTSLKHQQQGVPQVNFGLYVANSGSTTLQAPWQNELNLYSFHDDISWVKSQHTFKFGALLDFNAKNEDTGSGSSERPNVGSPAVSSGGYDTGDSLANLEFPSNVFNISETSTNVRAQLRWRNYELYAGDTYRMNPRLTLSYGVRYSLLLQPYQPNDQITSFQPSLFDPNKPASDACNGLWVAPGKDPCGAANKQFGTNFSSGTPGPNRSLVKNGFHNFAPRLGVIWDIHGNGKTVVHAGVGQFYQRERVSRYTLVSNAPFALTTNNYARTLGGGTPSSLSGAASPTGGINPSQVIPNSWQWNLAVEHALAQNTVLQVGYVGNRGIHLTSSYDVNAIPQSKLLAATFANSANVNSYRPFPNYGTLTYWDRGGNSNYNGLQVLLRSRIGSSLNLGIAYTWAHALADVQIDDSSGGMSAGSRTYPTNPKLDYGNSTVNKPNVLVANATWLLPKLQGTNFFEHHVLGGWELTGIVSATNGNSFTIFQGASENQNLVSPNSPTPAGQLNQTGALVATGFTNPNPLRPLATGQSCISGRHTNTIINPKAFTLMGYQLGTIPSSMERRGACGGPNFNNTDFSVDKNWHAGERLQVQFRLDFFNIFNHANFNPASLSQSSPIQDVNCGPVVGTGANGSLYNACSPTNNVVTRETPTSGFGTSSGLIGTSRQIQYGMHFTF